VTTPRRSAGALGACLFGAIVAIAPSARADDVVFGPHDVATVFFISKSDDKNRVDFGIHLDGDCVPVGGSAVFSYWREFEHAPPVRLHGLSLLDKIPYGIDGQGLVARTPAGADYVVRLKKFDRPIGIATRKEADGTCTAKARAQIQGAVAEFVSVYAKLAGLFSVDYIDIHGKDASGAPIVERVKK
jgi:hypothetical protein